MKKNRISKIEIIKKQLLVMKGKRLLREYDKIKKTMTKNRIF